MDEFTIMGTLFAVTGDIVYELAAIYNWGDINSMFQTMSTNPASTFASAYKSRQKVAEKTLEKTINEIRESLGQ